MMRVWKHINRLYGNHFILFINCEMSRLRSRIAAYINNARHDEKERFITSSCMPARGGQLLPHRAYRVRL